ncbi:MAG: hypothetical protein HFE43_05440 [Oscillospiraceae bacterium]|nr:hypothetical protein [Oscillospiraceae bacterium]
MEPSSVFCSCCSPCCDFHGVLICRVEDEPSEVPDNSCNCGCDCDDSDYLDPDFSWPPIGGCGCGGCQSRPCCCHSCCHCCCCCRQQSSNNSGSENSNGCCFKIRISPCDD